jgi:hypothetical protein
MLMLSAVWVYHGFLQKRALFLPQVRCYPVFSRKKNSQEYGMPWVWLTPAKPGKFAYLVLLKAHTGLGYFRGQRYYILRVLKWHGLIGTGKKMVHQQFTIIF